MLETVLSHLKPTKFLVCLIAPFFSWKGLSTKEGNSPKVNQKVNHSKQEFRRHIHLEMFKTMYLFMVHCSKELFWNSCFQQILYTAICLFFNTQPYCHLINTCSLHVLANCPYIFLSENSVFNAANLLGDSSVLHCACLRTAHNFCIISAHTYKTKEISLKLGSIAMWP